MFDMMYHICLLFCIPKVLLDGHHLDQHQVVFEILNMHEQHLLLSHDIRDELKLKIKFRKSFCRFFLDIDVEIFSKVKHFFINYNF